MSHALHAIAAVCSNGVWITAHWVGVNFIEKGKRKVGA